MNISFCFLFLIIFEITICIPNCKEGVDFCSLCNPVTKLCEKCEKPIYAPDENGGCSYAKKCRFGDNYCIECSEDGSLCKSCEEDYFPDKNGGCSFSQYCIISDKGNCLECEKGFVLIGIDDFFINGVRICKSLDSEDLQNCDRINTANGLCIFCKDGFYLNSGDNKCIEVQNCYESNYGKCKKCKKDYYLNKKENKCIKQEGIFTNCEISENGDKCDICNEDFYLAKDGICVSINYCSISTKYNKCKKCIEGFYLTNYENACTPEKNCFSGDKDFGICYSCQGDYYLDIGDNRKCKSNQDASDDFKYCEETDENSICKKCVYEYKLGGDKKCTKSQYCLESENQICKACIDNYHLGKDNLCVNVEHCIYSNYLTAQCLECEDNYYYDINNRTCKIAEGNFTNCKSSYNEEFCHECKDDFYLNQTDHLCYSNKEQGEFYKCGKSTPTGEKCMTCIDNYYLGELDNKCTTMEGCQISENENKCKQCYDYYFCLDLKTGRCEDNQNIISEEKKFYYRCNQTNEEGTACQNCVFEFSLNSKGLCVEKDLCEDEVDGVCQKCKEDDIYFYCLNKDFGCIEMFDGDGCLECNNNLDLTQCTKCMDGYELNHHGKCIEI